MQRRPQGKNCTPRGHKAHLLTIAHVSLKTPYAQTPHFLNHWKPTTKTPYAQTPHPPNHSNLIKPRELGLNDPESEKTLEDPTSKTQKVIAQVKRAVPGLMARDYGFFSTQTSLV